MAWQQACDKLLLEPMMDKINDTEVSLGHMEKPDDIGEAN